MILKRFQSDSENRQKSLLQIRPQLKKNPLATKSRLGVKGCGLQYEIGLVSATTPKILLGN